MRTFLVPDLSRAVRAVGATPAASIAARERERKARRCIGIMLRERVSDASQKRSAGGGCRHGSNGGGRGPRKRGRGMDEQTWLVGENFYEMVEYLRLTTNLNRTKAGRRKFRLFSCACAR